LRGDVSDYARTAAAHLEPDGWFVLCFPTPQKQRALNSLASAGFTVVRLRDVIPRETLAPLFSLFACRMNDYSGPTEIEAPLTVRFKCGRLTEEMTAVRRVFGFAAGTLRGSEAGCGT